MVEVLTIDPLYFLYIIWYIVAFVAITAFLTLFVFRARIVGYLIIFLGLMVVATLGSLTVIAGEQSGDPFSLAVRISAILGVIVMAMVWFFRRGVIRPLNVVVAKSRKMAEGNLTEDVDTGIRGTGETRALLYSSNEAIKKFKGMIKNIYSSNLELTNYADILANGANQVNTTTLEVTNTVQTIAEGAQIQVRRLNEVSSILNDMVAVIEESIREINNTSKITLDLAEQTNLVSLNAAIEASKAEEHGVGFTVVADHVRQLSIESRDAANSINAMVKNITQRMRDSVQAIVISVDRIANVAENTAAGSEEAAAAVEEQSASLQEITDQAGKLRELSNKTQRLIAEFKLE